MHSELKNKKTFQFALDCAMEYIDSIFDREVYPTEENLQLLEKFDENVPLESSTTIEIIEMLHAYGSPNTTASIGGRYYGFVLGSAVPAGLAAKTLATYWDQNSAMSVMSPVCSKIESVVEGWFRELLGLPENTVAGFVSGTSVANLCGLAAARYRVLERQGWNVNEKGLFGAPRVRLVAGRQVHSTILKAISILGFGNENIEYVDVDDQGRMIPDQVPELDENTILILQAGNLHSGSFDFFDEICDKANAVNAWVHIDGAFGLWAAVSEELSYLTKGIEKAQSWSVDGHKTLNTPYDSGIILCEDVDALTSALHMTGTYIIESPNGTNGMYKTPEMSRRARAIELWATLKFLGRNGLGEMITTLHKRTTQFAKEISEIDGFYVHNDVVFNQVIFSCENDDLTDRLVSEMQNLRVCWAGGSAWFGKRVVRISISAWTTTPEDISKSVKSFQDALSNITVN